MIVAPVKLIAGGRAVRACSGLGDTTVNYCQSFAGSIDPACWLASTFGVNTATAAAPWVSPNAPTASSAPCTSSIINGLCDSSLWLAGGLTAIGLVLLAARGGR